MIEPLVSRYLLYFCVQSVLFVSYFRLCTTLLIMNLSYNQSVSTLACSTTAFAYPDLFRAQFLSLDATLVSSYSRSIHTRLYNNYGGIEVVNVSFCNVTLSYTHPGHNDPINVQIWLLADGWNGRLQAISCGGFQAGLTTASLMGMTAAVVEVHSTVSTNARLVNSNYLNLLLQLKLFLIHLLQGLMSPKLVIP